MERAVPIRGVWLCREGLYAVVYVVMANGEQRKVIEEVYNGNFSHYVHKNGILCAPVTVPSDAEILADARRNVMGV